MVNKIENGAVLHCYEENENIASAAVIEDTHRIIAQIPIVIMLFLNFFLSMLTRYVDDRDLGMLDDVIADTSQQRAPQCWESAASHHNESDF